MKRLILLFIFLTTSFSASAFTNNGNSLLLGCSQVIKYLDGVRKNLDSDAVYCMGLLNGFRQATTFGHAIYGDKDNLKVDDTKGKKGICIPQSVTVAQLTRVTVKWLKEHPEQLHEAEEVLLFYAFFQSFPCNE